MVVPGGIEATVTHAGGSYLIRVESGLLRDLKGQAGLVLPGRRIATITDDTVRTSAGTWAGQLPGQLFSFPAGEDSKTRETWNRLTDALLAAGFGRDSGVVALGGGVVGDLAGFVAATYMRGIPVVQVPTTLLAMVDASIGGKVGVDTAHGKNLVGAFHPPTLVLTDPLALGTLPMEEFRAGLAEAVKHGLIADADYFEWIEANTAPILARDAAAVTHLVQRSVEIKAGIVSRDERETGERAVLNGGHTFGHAVEQAMDYRIRHGSAVAIGLVMECRLAEAIGVARPGLAARVGGVVHRLGLPTEIPRSVSGTAVREAMGLDKKNRAGRVRFALPSGIGAATRSGGDWTLEIGDEALAAILV